jgi:putative glutamine amidotransferase
MPLIRAALRHGVPLFAICRGMQELNVALGGTLIAEVQELPGRGDHRAPTHDDHDMRFAIHQDVEIRPGGVLAAILGAGTIQVNSLHRQAIGELAEGLAIEATAPDGTIEAVRVRDAASFALGVQWHPEYWVRTDKPSAQLFSAFGEAVRARLARRTATLSAAQ